MDLTKAPKGGIMEVLRDTKANIKEFNSGESYKSSKHGVEAIKKLLKKQADKALRVILFEYP